MKGTKPSKNPRNPLTTKNRYRPTTTSSLSKAHPHVTKHFISRQKITHQRQKNHTILQVSHSSPHLADVGFNSMISNDFFNLWPTQKQTLPAPRKDVNSKSRHCTANRNSRKPVPNSIKFSFFTTGFQCNKLDQIVTLTLIRRNCASGFTICDVSTAHDLRASDNPYPQQVSKS